MIKTDIYFGLAKPAGGTVTESEFVAFVAEVMTSDLHQGFTLIEAFGQFQEEDGSILKQPTKVAVFFHEDSPETIRVLEDLIETYRRRFGGAKAMSATSVADIKFYID